MGGGGGGVGAMELWGRGKKVRGASLIGGGGFKIVQSLLAMRLVVRIYLKPFETTINGNAILYYFVVYIACIYTRNCNKVVIEKSKMKIAHRN